MREITATPRTIIPLGKRGENDACVVKFPISGWSDVYGQGSFELLNNRPSENAPYTCSITTDEQFVYWAVQSADLALVGEGQCELTYIANGTIAKSQTFTTQVFESLEGSGEVPPPYESRIQDLLLASADIVQNVDRAEEAAETAVLAAQTATEDATHAVDQKIANIEEAVQEGQEALDSFEEQKDAIAQSVASMAQLGTDTTLTTTGMAADAEATGERLVDAERVALVNLDYETIEGTNPVVVMDGADNAPLKHLVFNIKYVQEGSGTSAPDNVRNIDGWTQAKVLVSPTDDPEDENGKIYTINFPNQVGKVYKGTLELNQDGSGVLTVTHVLIENPTITSYPMSGGYKCARFTYSGVLSDSPASNKFVYKPSGNFSAPYQYRTSSTGVCYVSFPPDTPTSTIDDIMDGSQYILKPYTAFVYNLTAKQVRTMFGENYISVDTGNITELTYCKQWNSDALRKSIESVVAGIEESFVASKDYAKGDFVIVNHTLYKLLVGVEEGQTLVPDVGGEAPTPIPNCIETTLEEAFDSGNIKNESLVNGETVTDALNTLGSGIQDLQNGGYVADAQAIQEKINAWLEAHPEATTTVLDESLAASKLVKGTLGYVFPEMFGAVGDGQTDDTVAMKDCIDFAITNGYYVHLLQKTYIVQSPALTFNIRDGQSIMIVGEGQNSIIKRIDGTLVKQVTGMLEFLSSPVNAPAHDVILSNFCVDGNRRGQSNAGPSSSYTYEANACIRVANGRVTLTDIENQCIDRVTIEHLRFYDPVGDCINLSGTVTLRVKTTLIDHIKATDRHGTRQDIGITTHTLGPTIIQNCDCGSIHFEFNEPDTPEVPARSSRFEILNSTFGHSEFLGRNRAELYMDNCIIGHAIFGLTKATILNSTLKLLDDGYSHRLISTDMDITFRNCNIISYKKDNVDPEGESDSFQNTYIYARSGGVRATFEECSFIYEGILNLDLDGDGVNDHVYGTPLTYWQSDTNDEYVIKNCYFDPVFMGSVNVKSGYVEFIDQLFTTYNAIFLSLDNNTTRGHVIFKNSRMLDSCKCLLNVLNVSSTAQFSVEGDIDCGGQCDYINYEMDDQIQLLVAENSGKFKAKFEINESFDFDFVKDNYKQDIISGRYVFYAFKGSEFIYDGNEMSKNPEKWIVTDSSVTALDDNGLPDTGQIPIGLRVKTIGNAYGSTEDRPTYYKNPGFVYFDTDIGQNITWDGSSWTIPELS